MLEEKTKWQQPLQNKKVGGNKFFLFSRTNMAATRLYIKPCFIFVLFSSPLTATKIIYSHGFYFCSSFYLDYLMGLGALSLFLMGLVCIGLEFD
jgi:hypothetical protein